MSYTNPHAQIDATEIQLKKNHIKHFISQAWIYYVLLKNMC